MGAGDSKNAKLWSDMLAETTKEAAVVSKEVLKSVSADMRNGVEPDQAKIKALAEEEAKKFDQAHAQMFEKVYNTYDADKNGVLDRKECKVLMAESLKAQRAYIPTQVDALLELSVKAGLGMAADMGCTKKHIEEAEKILRQQIKGMKSKVVKASLAIMDNLMKDSDALADQLFEKMDTNKDGHVSKEEFLAQYKKASAEVVDIQKMMSQMQSGMM